jgi:hypothetical protein
MLVCLFVCLFVSEKLHSANSSSSCLLFAIDARALIKSSASSESMQIDVTKLQLLPCQHVVNVLEPADNLPEEEFARRMKELSFAVKVRKEAGAITCDMLLL